MCCGVIHEQPSSLNFMHEEWVCPLTNGRVRIAAASCRTSLLEWTTDVILCRRRFGGAPAATHSYESCLIVLPDTVFICHPHIPCASCRPSCVISRHQCVDICKRLHPSCHSHTHGSARPPVSTEVGHADDWFTKLLDAVTTGSQCRRLCRGAPNSPARWPLGSFHWSAAHTALTSLLPFLTTVRRVSGPAA